MVAPPNPLDVAWGNRATDQDTLWQEIHKMCRKVASELQAGEMLEDYAQEAAMTIFEGMAGFQGKSKFSTWAYQVARNRVVHMLRKQAVRNRTMPERDIETLSSAEFRELSTEGQVSHEDRMLIDEAVAGLPDSLQAVVSRRLKGQTFEDIASELGLDISAVYSRWERALGQIRSAKRCRG